MCPVIDCSLVSDDYTGVDNHCGNRNKMNCDLQFDDTFSSLFGSIINFGCLFGALAGGMVVDKVGKKVGMHLALMLYTVGWILIFFVPDPDVKVWDATESDAGNMGTIKAMLIAARLIIGFGVGIVCCSVSNYQTEICTLNLRGAIGTCFQLFIVIGLLTVYLLGSFINWRPLSMICLVVSVAGFFLTFLICESPVWLLTKGRTEEAAANLARVRNPDVGDLQQQLAEIEATAGDDADDKSEHSVSRGSFLAAGGNDDEFDFLANRKLQDGRRGSTLEDALNQDQLEAGGLSELCADPVSRKALRIGVGLMFVQQLSGINAIMFYAGQIFSAVPGTSDSTANTYSTGMQAMQVLITLGSAFFMDRFGRVKILLWSATGQCAMAFCLAAYYLFASCEREDPLDVNKVTTASMGVFPVVSLYGYVFFFSCGMGAIPWFVMGEIFKPNVKGIASSIATAVNWLLSFVITFSVSGLSSAFKDMFEGALPDAIDPGMGGLFLAYGSVCFCGIFFILGYIPETKGLTISEVQAKLAGKDDSGDMNDKLLADMLSDDDEVPGRS